MVDGDSLRMGVTKIRLQGIDAPECDQVCHLGTPLKRYRCGLAAKDALTTLIAGRSIDCEIEPEPTDTVATSALATSLGSVSTLEWSKTAMRSRFGTAAKRTCRR